MKRVFVTGFDGYVGSAVVRGLKARGVAVHVLARDAAAADKALERGLIPTVMQLGDGVALKAAARAADAVAHLAASENPTFLAVQRGAIAALLSGLGSGKPFVMQGGSMVFGDTGPSGVAGVPAFAPPPPMAERAALDAWVLEQSASGVRTHIVYGSFVFGGRGAMIPGTLMAAAAQARSSGYVGDGSARWSAVHVADWADLMVRVLLDGNTSGKAVLAAAQEFTTREIAESVAAAFAPWLPVESLSPERAAERWGFFASALGVSQRFDPLPARTQYDWNPVPHPLVPDLKALASSAT